MQQRGRNSEQQVTEDVLADRLGPEKVSPRKLQPRSQVCVGDKVIEEDGN